jgi:poly[(R)-3-hydroxyalkanoate] polymerase subunit PhaE
MATLGIGAVMSDKPKLSNAAGSAADWSNLWQSMVESSSRMAKAWSGSVAPFMIARASEKATGEINDLSAAIERMAQGPQLADIWDFDRKLALAFAAWIDLRTRLANYNAVASTPWTEASRRFVEEMPKSKAEAAGSIGWREMFAKWAEISNQELIKNQRTDAFLKAQKEMLQAAVQYGSRQNDVSDAISALFDIPTRRDLDEITRQLTELRRELRALKRQQERSKGQP